MNVDERKPLTQQRSPWNRIDGSALAAMVGVPVVAAVRNVHDGQLRLFTAQEPIGWHLSISFIDRKGQPSRYPTWDEIAHARDEFLPADIGFVMHLPPAAEYVALHDSTFHLHQHPAPVAP